MTFPVVYQPKPLASLTACNFQPDSGAKDKVSVEKTFPFAVDQEITNDITDILFQSVHCCFPIGQFQNKFTQPENLPRNWDFPQPFQRRSESLTEGLESSRN